MKIYNIQIKNFKQFNNTFLDFTDPNTGKPADKICFIGRNGTGKSTLLDFINGFLKNPFNFIPGNSIFYTVKIKFGEQDLYLFNSIHLNHCIIFRKDIEKINDWFSVLSEKNDKEYIREQADRLSQYCFTREELEQLRHDLVLKHNSSDLLIYSPPESQQNSYMQVGDVPQTSLDQSLKLFDIFPFDHVVSDQNVQEFWKILIFLIKKREDERDKFENRKENLNKTKKQLIEEFDSTHPKILNRLGKLWNRILEKAGLEFDVENASNPIQLNDNLKAYIRLKFTKEKISYSQLSTGIRNFIFRVGHIYSLYFNREIKRGFLLIDEPENSLFPDFLFDLVNTYIDLLVDKKGENNTQFFVSTHNPIIAAQFEPYERIILEWDTKGNVEAFKGNAPAGDDPNDVLKRDFGLKNLMGKQGQEMWEKYIKLRKQLRKTHDKNVKDRLISEINKIGAEYNFEE